MISKYIWFDFVLLVRSFSLSTLHPKSQCIIQLEFHQHCHSAQHPGVSLRVCIPGCELHVLADLSGIHILTAPTLGGG